MWPSIFKGELGLRDIAVCIAVVAIAVHLGLTRFYFAMLIGLGLFLLELLHKEGISTDRAIEAFKYALLGLLIVAYLAWLNNQSLVAFINSREDYSTKFLCSLPVVLASYGIVELIASFFISSDSEV
jgi:hypothetical protein